jgi:hypothetical protein
MLVNFFIFRLETGSMRLSFDAHNIINNTS